MLQKIMWKDVVGGGIIEDDSKVFKDLLMERKPMPAPRAKLTIITVIDVDDKKIKKVSLSNTENLRGRAPSPRK